MVRGWLWSEEKSAKQVTVMYGIYDSDNETIGGELTFEELSTVYKELCLKSQ